MTYSISEVCQMTNKNRSEIYALLNSSKMHYLISQDGKRKIETAELTRVFPDINFNLITNKPNKKLFQPRDREIINNNKEADLRQTKEMQDLRSSMLDLKKQIEEVLADNRRLLRLLEYQTEQNTNHKAPPIILPNISDKDDTKQGNHTHPADLLSTDMAKQGWKEYQKMRHQLTDNESDHLLDDKPAQINNQNTAKPIPDPNLKSSISEPMPVSPSDSFLTIIKRFFFKP